MYAFFDRLFESCGYFAGIFVEIGKMPIGVLASRFAQADSLINCVNVITGAEFDFSFNIARTLALQISSEYNFFSVLFSSLLFGVAEITQWGMSIFGFALGIVAQAFPRFPAYLGLAFYFVFVYGYLKLFVSLFGKLIGYITGGIAGASS